MRFHAHSPLTALSIFAESLRKPMAALSLLTILTATIGNALASESDRCIKVDYVNGGYDNTCPQTVALKLCVRNPSSMFSCTGNSEQYLTDVLPKGTGHGILYYQRDGQGDVAFVTCNYPLMVLGWKGPGTAYRCVDPNAHSNVPNTKEVGRLGGGADKDHEPPIPANEPSPHANAGAYVAVPGCFPIHPPTCVQWKKIDGKRWTVRNNCGAAIQVTLSKDLSTTILSPGQVWPGAVEAKPAQYLVRDSDGYEGWFKSVFKGSTERFNNENRGPCYDKLLAAQQSGNGTSDAGHALLAARNNSGSASEATGQRANRKNDWKHDSQTAQAEVCACGPNYIACHERNCKRGGGRCQVFRENGYTSIVSYDQQGRKLDTHVWRGGNKCGAQAY